jgi:HK97 family phage major capsid protein
MTATIEEIKSLFEQFKVQNDARDKEIEKYGVATAETTAKVDRINAAIDQLQDTLTQRMDDLETRLNRPLAGGRGGERPTDQRMALYARWQSEAQGKDVDPGDVDLKFIQDYSRAFRSWVRRGDRDSERILNEMSVASPPDGGFLVSPDTAGRIVEMLYETSPIRQLCAPQAISSDALEGVFDLDEAGAGWVGEAVVRAGNTATPQVGTWRIPAHEMYAEPNATQKLLDDTQVDIEAWLAGKVAARFGRLENTAFVAGNGVLRPRGFLTYPNGVPTAALWQVVQQVASGNANLLTADGLIDLVGAVKDGYQQNAVFGMRRATQTAVRKFKDGNGNYLWQPDFAQGRRATLLGFPIVDMADMPAVAAGNLPVVFGDFRAAYQIVDRFGIRVLRDPYTRKGFVKFYTTKRVGGDLLNFEAIALQVVSL